MGQHFKEFLFFSSRFLRYAYYIRGILVGLVTLICLGGVLISYLEDLHMGESIYFAFVTGLTIGYGDIAPVTGAGRLASAGLGLVGMLFTGMTVAIATRALADTVTHIQGE